MMYPSKSNVMISVLIAFPLSFCLKKIRIEINIVATACALRHCISCVPLELV